MPQARLGIGGTASYAAGRLAAILPGVRYHRYRLIAVPLSGMPSMPRGYTVVTAENFQLDGRIDANAATMAYRRAQEADALAAVHKDEIVGVTWLTARPFAEDEARALWVPPDGMAWDTGMWVRPDRRLSRAFSALWAGTADWLRQRGLHGSASRIADYNLGSLAPHSRMHARSLGTVTFAGVGGLQVATRGCPRFTWAGVTRIETGARS